jgi:hypothetical protein
MVACLNGNGICGCTCRLTLSSVITTGGRDEGLEKKILTHVENESSRWYLSQAAISRYNLQHSELFLIWNGKI